jgi:hypothetical protein
MCNDGFYTSHTKQTIIDAIYELQGYNFHFYFSCIHHSINFIQNLRHFPELFTVPVLI